MLTILNLFGRSPFAPFQTHMEKVAGCVELLSQLFAAMKTRDYGVVNSLASEISKMEHEADITKNDIRNHLPRSLFLPIDRTNFLEILRLQDGIADQVEDIAVMTTLKNLEFPERIIHDFDAFLEKNIDTFKSTYRIIQELDDLLESSFGGIEAEKVNALVDTVAYKEHEADIIQRELVKSIILIEDELSYSSFYLWMHIFEKIGAISDICEKLAYRMRMTLDLK